MTVVYVILLIVLLVILVFVLARSRFAGLFARIRSRFDRPRANTGVTIVEATGAAYDVPSARGGRYNLMEALSRRLAWNQAIGRSERLLVVLVIILIGLVAFWQVQNLLPNRIDRFLVLVAPFSDRGGSVSQTGRAVADGLTAPLTGQGLRVVRIADPPSDLNAALALMESQGADAMITGTVEPGGMPDQPSVTPVLIYRPTGTFAPAGWAGYSGRFAMPAFYALSDAPINARVVLPELLGALENYRLGRVDAAFAALGKLAADTPALRPVLPYALRGNILWARGQYDQAADEYRRALAGAPEPQPLPDSRPLLVNNLGAIQQDAGDPNARATLAQAADLLAGRDLGALRYNLGIADLRDNKYGDAAASLEAARNLLPTSTPLLLTLSQTYRMDGRLAEAQEALNAAAQELRVDTQATTADLRDITGSRLQAAVAEQRALLRLAVYLQARGPLMWELRARDQLDQDEVSQARTDLAEAVGETDALVQGWNRRAASEDAADHPIGGQLAINQFRQAETLLRDRHRWQDALAIELARTQGVETPRGLAALWRGIIGDRSPLTQGRADLKRLLDTQPNDADAGVLYGEALLLSNDSAGAADWFGKAAAAAPRRPEPVFGQALVAEKGSQPEQAIDLLNKAIDLDGNYLPARQKLAALAEATKQWAIAIQQRRWLAQQRPSFAHTIELASTLRRSGTGGYAEAERALLSLVNDNQLNDIDKVPALVELGQLYFDNGDPATARAVLERAQRTAPSDPAVAYQLGRVLAASGDPLAAKAQFQRAIANGPRPVQAYIELAKLYAANRGIPELTQDEGSDAITRQYRAALDAGADDPAQLRLIGQQLLADGVYEPAALAYDRLVKADPNDAEAHHGLAQANLHLGRLDAAQAEEQQALDLKQGTYPEALAGLGEIALLQGKPDEAVQHYNTALDQNRDLVAAYIGLGRVAAAADNWSVAGAHFQQAIEHDTASAQGHFWLGEALLQQHRASAAIGEYNQAVTLKPDYAEAYYGRARAQIETAQTDQQLDEAARNLDQALAIRPSYADALLTRGKLYEQRGDDTRAIDSYGKAISANARLAEPRYRRGRLLIRQERMGEAESDLAAATGIQPNFPEAHYWLGRVYLAEERPQAARDEFKRAIEQRSGNYPEASFYQGIAEEQLGQREEAAASFRSALEQAGDSAWASDARAALARLEGP
jgi:tetratricopeptide (TPR) repeat protein